MDEVLKILFDGLWASIAATGFAAVSNPPKMAFKYVPIIAAIGHMIRFILITYLNLDAATSTFVSAFIIGLMAVGVCIKVSMPSEVFSFPSLLPMVPGLLGYKALLGMMRFMQSNDPVFRNEILPDIVSNGISAALIMFALGVGVSIPILLFQKRINKHAKRSVS